MEPIDLEDQLWCQRVLNAQGFLIMSSNTLHPLGHVLTDAEMYRRDGMTRLMPPMRVVDYATQEEYLRQCKTFEADPKGSTRALFYKVIAE